MCNDPSGTRKTDENVAEIVLAAESDAKSDALNDEVLLIQAFRRLPADDRQRQLGLAELGLIPRRV